MMYMRDMRQINVEKFLLLPVAGITCKNQQQKECIKNDLYTEFLSGWDYDWQAYRYAYAKFAYYAFFFESIYAYAMQYANC